MYGKLFSSMYEGSLYGDWKAIVTFQQMIILCGPDGVVDMTPHALAARTSIPLEIIQAGIASLEAPDQYSRSPEQDGRRIERIDSHRPWGWRIVNYVKYRRLIDAEEKRAADRVRIAKKRAAEKTGDLLQDVADSATVAQKSQSVADVAQAEAEAEVEAVKDVLVPNGTSMSKPDDFDAPQQAVLHKANGYRLPACPYQELVDAYHELLPCSPRVEVLSDQRKRHMQARWRQVCADEKRERAAGVQWFREFFEHAGKSAFLTGKTRPKDGRKPFVASLDWLMDAEAFVKVYEGRYHS